MTEQDERAERLRLFFEEIAGVMDRHENVSRNFVLAEADPSDMAVSRTAGAVEVAAAARAAADEMLSLAEAPRRKVCIRFGIDPRTGRRICLQWVDAG